MKRSKRESRPSKKLQEADLENLGFSPKHAKSLKVSALCPEYLDGWVIQQRRVGVETLKEAEEADLENLGFLLNQNMQIKSLKVSVHYL